MVTNTSSIITSFSAIIPKCAVWLALLANNLGFNVFVLNTFSVTAMASFPLKRITAIAPKPCGVASAAIVSLFNV
mgnify:CR=1 FL=1